LGARQFGRALIVFAIHPIDTNLPLAASDVKGPHLRPCAIFGTV
jgi:hypothetical protein